MDLDITAVLALGLRFLPEAALLTETGPDWEEVIFVNQTFERLSGYSLQDLQQQGLLLLQGPGTDRSTLQQILDSSQGESVGPFEVLLYKKDSTPFWDRVKITTMETGNRSFRVQVHSDVTVQKETEKRFILAQKREVTSHLVSGVAHDFNNLLTAILVYAGLMAPKVREDAQLKRYVDEVHNSAERGSQLVDQLLNLGREETADPEPVDLSALVEENTDLLRRVLREDMQLSIQTGANVRKVRAHPGEIQRILLNLAINARDAMPHGGELLIQLANEEGNGVLLLVRDNGTGMDGETLAKIFEPFVTKGKGKGTGLGLFVVRAIVEQYQGRISVESERDKGTTFKILLPAA